MNARAAWMLLEGPSIVLWPGGDDRGGRDAEGVGDRGTDSGPRSHPSEPRQGEARERTTA